MLSDEGKYRCVGSNLAGSRSSKEFEVSVEVRGQLSDIYISMRNPQKEMHCM